MHLSISMNGMTTVKEALNKYTAVHMLTDDNKYMCKR